MKPGGLSTNGRTITIKSLEWLGAEAGRLVPAVAAALAILLTAPAEAAERAPIPVSPGEEARIATMASECPTFHFAPSRDARGHRIAVYRAGEDGGVGREPLVQVDLPGLAAGWTPPLGRCLEAGRTYAWAVGALPQDPADDIAWSEVRVFRVAGGSPDDRLVEREAVVSTRPSTPGSPSAPMADLDPLRPAGRTAATPGAVQHSVAPLLGTPDSLGFGLDLEVPDSLSVFEASGMDIRVDSEANLHDPLNIYGLRISTNPDSNTWDYGAWVESKLQAVYGRATEPTGTGVTGIGTTGVSGDGTARGGHFRAAPGGRALVASAVDDADPDLELSASFGDEDGILTSKVSDTGSDLIFRSNDELDLVIDYDDNEPQDDAHLRVKAGAETVFRIHKSGNVYADGGYHCGNDISSGADLLFNELELEPCLEDNAEADFAEMMPSAQPGLEPADLLALRPDGRLERSSVRYQTSVAGVVSTRPSYLGNSRYAGAEGWVPMALVGIVPVKATAANGAIGAGDLLAAADLPGHAMRATAEAPAGSIVGKALEPLRDGRGQIRMLVLNR